MPSSRPARAITLKAAEIRRGMIVEIHGGEQRVSVVEIRTTGAAVEIRGMDDRWYGLDAAETAYLVGHFNPEK